jgi:hypothetical protein
MLRYASIALACVLVSAAAQAQNTGEIFGKVTDASGAVLPGVTVTVASPVLLQPRVAVTSETGSYDVPGLTIGTYTVKFELSGFATLTREDIQLRAGFSAQINGQLQIAGVKEDVVVTGTSPIIDTRSTTSGEHFNTTELQALPTGRDVFNMFQKAPAIIVNTSDVGGNTLGTQTNFVSRGASVSQVRSFSDGADVGTGNNMPFYVDFDGIEELQINTGGADVTMQTSGATINMISKSGTDKFRGQARLYITDQSVESNNIDTALRNQGASAGNPLLNIKDYGFEVGGPIKPGRLWFYASSSRQTVATGVPGFYQNTDMCNAVAANPLAYSVTDVRQCLNPATNDIRHINYKVSAQLDKADQFSFRNSYDLKLQLNRGGSNLIAPSATTRLLAVNDSSLGSKFWTTGWPPLWRFADQHIFSDRWMAEAAYTRFCPCTNIALADDSLITVQPEIEVSTGAQTRSAGFTTLGGSGALITFPIKNTYDVSTNYFLPGKWGGDHALKAGFKDLYFPMTNETHTGGNAEAEFNSGALPAFSVPFAAIFTRDSILHQNLYQQSLYVQDTYTHTRVALTLGVRWDRQRDSQNATSVPASPFQGQLTATGTPFTFLPAVNFPGAGSPVVFKNLAPRLGVSYDVTGNGRNVIKASYSMYYDQLNPGQLSSVLNPIGAAAVQFAWTDLNGDKVVQANEVNTSRILAFGGGYNPANPAQITSPNQVDPNLKNSHANEVVVGFDKDISGVGVSAKYIYRHYSDFFWNQIVGISSANYSALTFTPAANTCGASARCQSVTYYAPNIPLPSPFILTNRPDYYQRFNGFEAVAHKQAARWMLTASYSYNTTVIFYASPASYQDPTNVAQQNGAQYSPAVAASGLPTQIPNAKWIARFNGSYRIPWHDIGLAANIDTRQGYPFLQTVNVASRPNAAGAVQVLLDSPGAVRLPNFAQTDLRVDKTFTFGRTKLKGMVDVFNLFNSNTVLGQNAIQNALNANLVSTVIAPRVVRFGAALNF